MKTNYIILASFSLGLMVASCQSGLEDVLEQSSVQNEQATTRAENKYTEKNNITVTSMPSTNSENETIETAISYIAGPDITSDATYYNIIGGTEEVTYYFSSSIPSDVTSIQWEYSSGIFTEVNTTYAGITLKLTNSSSSTDGTLTAKFYVGSTEKYRNSLSIGVNGPVTGSGGSLTIVRTSDSAVVYPFSNGAPFTPNTYYYGTFSSSYPVSLTEWDFNNQATILSQSGYNCHFQTDSSTWWLLDIKGTMSPYNVEKTLYTAWLYGQ